jgi:hypothetical protein
MRLDFEQALAGAADIGIGAGLQRPTRLAMPAFESCLPFGICSREIDLARLFADRITEF